MPTFDIAAKIVTDKQRAFVVHAGKERRNHTQFIENGIAFLEVPYLGLTKEMLQSRTALRRAIRRQQLRFRYEQDPARIARPSDVLADYPGTPLDDSGLTRLVGSIGQLYSRMNVGDVIITPGFEMVGKYRRPIVHFGEISQNFDPDRIHIGSLPRSQSVPVRSVNWLRSVPRSVIPPAIEARIGKPPAVREIVLTDETSEILNFTYSNYIYDGGSSSLVKAPRYTGEKFIILNDSSRLIELLTAAYAYAHNDQSAASPNITNLKSFRDEFFSQSGVENIQVDFNSPGFWRIVGGTATLAAFVALGVAIFTTGMPEGVLRSGITVVNSVSAAEGQVSDIQESMNYFLNSLSSAQIAEIQADAVRAKDQIGLVSPVQQIAGE